MSINQSHDNTIPDFTTLVADQDYVLNQVIVTFEPSIGATNQLATFKSENPVSVIETTQTLGIELWQMDNMSVEDMIFMLRDTPGVLSVEPNYIVYANVLPNDPEFDQLWGLNNTGQTGGTPDADIDAPEAWEIQTGESVLVGVIDTGVDYTHPDLINNIWTNPGEIPGNGIDDDGNGYIDDVHGYDFVNDDGDPWDDHYHGTHVAGTIAAQGDNNIGVSGVSWSAQIMPIKFLNSSGSGTTFDAIQAVEYATMMGVQLTNNSWGGGGYSQGLYDAIAAAGEAGQLFVAAAGNSGSSAPSYPAAYDLDNIISVAATDHNDHLASFSNYGADSVDIAAPGVNIYSTLPNGGYGSLNGTSMASPHVAGVVSLIWSEFPELTAQEVKERILYYSDPIPELEGLTLSGGRLNAYNALTETPPPPGEIHGSKWHDIDEDGIWDESEPGLAGWTIYLDDNQNGELDPGELTTTTDINGNYAFTDLSSGIYTVAEVLPENWQQTYPGFNGGFETGNFASWQTTGNTTIETSNFGSGPSEGIYQGLLTNSGNVSDSQLESFLGLASGSLDGLGNGNATAGSAIKQTVTVTAGTELSFDWNFLTNEATPTSSFNDFGFVSITSDNPDISDTLANTYGSFISSPTSFNEETGFATFSHTFSTDGTFTIGVGVIDVGDTIVDSGLLVDNFTFIGDVTTSPGNQTVSVSPGEVVTGIDFGNYALLGQIQGTKWNDLNGNGVFDANEPGLAGWTIYLDDNQNGQLDADEISTTTDINGNYSFIDLEAGTYTVAEVLLPGWQQTYPVAPTTEYQWSDSDQSGGPVFNWIDISGIGTEINLYDDDYEQVALPFDFLFYGEEKDTVKISSNGYLSFGANATIYSNTPIPNANDPDDLIAPFWDDLNPGVGGDIYYYHDQAEDQFIVQYDNVPRYSSGGALTFQVILDSDGSILYQYDQMNAILNSATIGIENADGSDGLQVAYNQNYIHDDLAVSITPVSDVVSHTVDLELGEIATDISFGNQKLTPTTIYGTPGDDVFTIVDSPVIVYALAGDDSVDGSQSLGANQFYAGSGNDTLIGNNYDQLYGQAGDDVLDVSNGAGHNSLYGGKGNDTLLANVHDQLFGDKGNDILDASNGSGYNFLDGGKGNDSLFANVNDYLSGGDGNDTLDAANGLGNNNLSGGNGNDILLAGTNDNLSGGNGDDILDALNGTGNNYLAGDDGDDILLANVNDQLDGGEGDDILNASNGSGNNSLFGGSGDDVLLANFNDQLDGGEGDDLLNASNGAGNNSLLGGSGDDILLASANDQLDGGDGDDILSGGYGGSTMTGGTGDDWFWIANGTLPSIAQTITDFEVDSELIGIGGLGLSFSNLTITQSGEDTLIAAFNTNLAILTGIQADTLNAGNFVLT